MFVSSKPTIRPGRTAAFRVLVVVAALALLLWQGEEAHAATFTVDSNLDLVDANIGNGVCAAAGGQCTLRAAIQEANFTVAGDTINVPAGTYTLTIAGTGEDAGATGDLDILHDVNINRAGAATTIIDGAGLDRVIDIRPGSGTVEISGATIKNGNTAGDGGGIRSESALTLKNGTVVIENTAAGSGGGVYNAGMLTMMVSSVSANSARVSGGGIYNPFSATATLEDSRVTENRTPLGDDGIQGGGIFNNGTMSLKRSVVSGNWTHLNVATLGAGGGIYNAGLGMMTLDNTTVSSNRTHTLGGGIYKAGLSTLTLNNSTVYLNTAGLGGGGIYGFEGTVTLKNTVVANSTPDNCLGNLGTFFSDGHNLASDFSCNLGSVGDQPNTNPLLGPLAGNDGYPETHALLPGSPAIDAGNPGQPGSGGNTCEPTDQRGITRPVDGDGDGNAVCDIGAFELGFVGGKAALPDVARMPLEADQPSGPSAGVLAGIAAVATAGVVALGGAAWYARRRRVGL